MWSGITLDRGPGGALSDETRRRLVTASDEEAAAAVAYVEAREADVERDGADPARIEAARASFAEAQRVRELLRVRAYSIETERTWAALPAGDRDAIRHRLAAVGADATPGAASTVIGMTLNQLVVARLVALASSAMGTDATAGEAMLGLPIAFQLEVIRETGADLRVPGEVLRVLEIARG